MLAVYDSYSCTLRSTFFRTSKWSPNNKVKLVDLSSERGGVILEWREIPELGITSDVMITPIPRNLFYLVLKLECERVCSARERVPGIETELHSSLVEMR